MPEKNSLLPLMGCAKDSASSSPALTTVPEYVELHGASQRVMRRVERKLKHIDKELGYLLNIELYYVDETDEYGVVLLRMCGERVTPQMNGLPRAAVLDPMRYDDAYDEIAEQLIAALMLVNKTWQAKGDTNGSV